MKIAYLILAHTDAEQLKNLVTALQYENCDFYIHIDKKQSKIDFLEKLQIYKNVFFLDDSKRVNIYWAGFNMVEATLNLMDYSITKKYDRYVLLSGLDYPIKTPQYIYDFFKDNKETEYIEAFKIRNYEEYKVKKYWFFDLPIKSNSIRNFFRRILKVLISNNPLINKEKTVNINGTERDIFFSAQWIALTHDCLEYIISIVNTNPNITRFFKYSYAPDELFFATIIANSPFKKNMVCCSTEKFPYKAPLHEIEYGESVKVYTDKDFSYLINSEKLFCRKCKSKESKNLIELLVKRYERS